VHGNVVFARRDVGGRQQSGKEVTPGCFKKQGRNFFIIATSINAYCGEKSGGLLLAVNRREE
jgi:hypothetical protein